MMSNGCSPPSHLPKYSNPYGVYDTLPLRPPFLFQGMTTNVFPLRANPLKLQEFCQRYVNFIPEKLGRFEVFLPYVYLMVLDYGRLAAPVANYGWLAQHEIMFTIPVEWYRVVDGRWQFHDWAWITPFIYVDSELSLLLGRQTYGWPKSLVQLTPTISKWMSNPDASIEHMSMSAKVLPKMFVGDKQTPRVIMDISQDAGLLASRWPPDMASPLMPWMALANSIQGSAALMQDLALILGEMGITRWQRGATPENYAKMAAIAARMMNPYKPDLVFNTINLKQFRDSQAPERYCYQALTNAPMRIQQFQAIGLLGAINQFAGDVSGGFCINLYEWPGYPIVDLLGLEVARSWHSDDVKVAELQPVIPFWYSVDMEYGRGVNIAWRSLDGVWHDAEGKKVEPGPCANLPANLRYNTTLGVSASQPVAGVFSFTDTTLRVLPLLARRPRLQMFLDEYLNKPLAEGAADPPARFEVWGPPGDAPCAHVYMVATDYGTMVSPEANIGSWQSESLSILVPVRYLEFCDGQWVLRGLGLVPAYSFTDSTQAFISNSEVLGIPMTKGVFVSPPNVWMSSAVKLEANQPLLRIASEVLPVLDLGQEATLRQIIEIAKGSAFPETDRASWERMATSVVWAVHQEHQRKKGQRDDQARGQQVKDQRALALEVLTNEVPINLYTMKQFRDATWVENACYQAIVRIPHVITHLYDLQEIEFPIHVEIREYPSLPIVEMLGLVGHLAADQTGGGVVYKLIPLRPFWLRMAWKQELGRQMWYRATSKWWQPGDDREGDARPRRPLPLRLLEPLLSDGDPSALREFVAEHLDLEDEKPLGDSERTQALRESDPQMIIDTVLSREWGHAGEDSRWRRRRTALEQELKETIASTPDLEGTREVIKFFKKLVADVLDRYRIRPGKPSWERFHAALAWVCDFEQAFSDVDGAYGCLLRGEEPAEPSLPEALLGHITTLHEILNRPIEIESITDRRRRQVLIDKMRELASPIVTAGGQQWVENEARRPENFLVGLFTLGQASGATSGTKRRALRGPHKKAMGEIFQLLRLERQRRRMALLTLCSKAAQKPDICTRRSVAGPHAERLFPLDKSWDLSWFSGNDAPQPEESRAEDPEHD